MAKLKKKIDKKKKAKETPSADEDGPIVIVDDTPKAIGNRVSVGQRFWLVPKGHRKPAREVVVASMGADTVRIRCLDNGDVKVLPSIAFSTAGQSRVLRA